MVVDLGCIIREQAEVPYLGIPPPLLYMYLIFLYFLYFLYFWYLDSAAKMPYLGMCLSILSFLLMYSVTKITGRDWGVSVYAYFSTSLWNMHLVLHKYILISSWGHNDEHNDNSNDGDINDNDDDLDDVDDDDEKDG